MHGIRVSDALNADILQKQRYLPLANVIVRSLDSGAKQIATEFLLVSHSQITAVIPLEAIEDDVNANTFSDTAHRYHL